MNRDEKAAVVEEIAGQLAAAEAVFAIDYRGLSVTQAADLRSKLKDADTVFRVVKNSLTERAADQAGAESLKPLLEGPTALALVHGDAALAAKALNDTARTLRLLEFKGGIMSGSTLSADEIRSIARLPARDVLNGQLVGVVAAPLSGLVRTLNALIAGVAVQLQQIAEQRPPEDGGAAAAAPGPTDPEPAPDTEAGQPEPETEPAGDGAPADAEGEAESEPAEAEEAPAEAKVEAESEPPAGAPAEGESESSAEAAADEAPVEAEGEPTENDTETPAQADE